MKNKKRIITLIAFTAIVLGLPTKCTVEPEYYSQVSPESFFVTQERVYQRLARPFTHWAWGLETVPLGRFVVLNTLSADEIVMPNRNGDWYDDGFYMNHYDHSKFSPTTDAYWAYTWDAFSQGVAQTYSAIEDIDANVDFDALGFPAGTREATLNQLNVLVAYFYLYALDNFGGVPLYKSNQGDPLPCSTDKETFDFIEKLLTDALPTLPKRKAGEVGTGYPTQGVAAALLARLYFNAESYIGTNGTGGKGGTKGTSQYYTKCAEICTKFEAEEYGVYKLAGSFQEIFGFHNDGSDELIWAVPHQNGFRTADAGRPQYGTHYNTKNYLDNPGAESWNGLCLVPSLDMYGKSYLTEGGKLGGPFKLGSPYAKFNDADLRKKNYHYKGNQEYEGMFLAGKLINPDATTTNGVCLADGSREYPLGDTIPMRDQVAHLADIVLGGTPGYKKRYTDDQEGINYAEENSGVRLMKYSPIPSATDNSFRYNADVPVIRYTEIRYMLAECKYRAGDKTNAATIINDVRKRYFEGGDPDPVSSGFDEYRLLDEWLIEFLGEGRRRTDLVRWGMFVTENWWDHKATNDPKHNRFPIPIHAKQANPLIVQNY
jgi:hypothetical protein